MRAIVLAGQRPGGDPLARSLGIDHKALILVGDVPMLVRVIQTLKACPEIEGITIVTEDPGRMPEIEGVEWLVAAPTPSLSVLAALESVQLPALVTTADHALLTPAHIKSFIDQVPKAVDIGVALVAKTIIARRFPQARRTYLRFRDDGYSGANLFLLQTSKAVSAVSFWRRVEMNRKKPWHIARALGPGLLLGYLFRRFAMAAGVQRAGAAMGVVAHGVALPFAEAAVDVDKLADLELAQDIIAGKA